MFFLPFCYYPSNRYCTFFSCLANFDRFSLISFKRFAWSETFLWLGEFGKNSLNILLNLKISFFFWQRTSFCLILCSAKYCCTVSKNFGWWLRTSVFPKGPALCFYHLQYFPEKGGNSLVELKRCKMLLCSFYFNHEANQKIIVTLIFLFWNIFFRQIIERERLLFVPPTIFWWFQGELSLISSLKFA